MPSTAVAQRSPAMAMGSLEDPERLGTLLAASGFFSDTRDAAQAVVKVLAGAELGFGPIASMTGVFIVKGRVTLSANLVAASIKRHPAYDYRIKTHTADACEIEFFQADKSLGSVEFTMDMARRAKIASGENWTKYPEAMLFARALTSGARWMVPDVFAGSPIYTPDELGVATDPETGAVLDVPDSPPFDRVTGEVIDPAPIEEPAPPPGPSETPPPDPAPSPNPSPTPEPEQAPPPEPPPSNANGGGNAAAIAPLDGDANVKVNDAEVAKLRELLDSLGAPQSFVGMALVTYRVDDLADLTRGQAHEVMTRAAARFGK